VQVVATAAAAATPGIRVGPSERAIGFLMNGLGEQIDAVAECSNAANEVRYGTGSSAFSDHLVANTVRLCFCAKFIYFAGKRL
jgi:hypothetical protein